ncbi:MAG: alpha/beta hydrolase [Eubacteriales bacterium]|nr:alpha/beta hydrolase [Eubacteriales bacterium]
MTTYRETKSPDTIVCIPDDGYAAFMDETVQPALAAIVQSGFFERISGQPIYWEHYPKENARGTVIICHGYAESAEKFREMAWYFWQAGLRVYAVDHRGHGQSYRYSDDYSLTHVERFDDYVDDLAAFATQVAQGEPLLLYGHSMGGAIAARMLQEHPGVFRRAVLNAPMIQVNPGKYPALLGLLMADYKVWTGHGQEYLFLHGPFNPNARFEQACCTSRARYDYYLNRQIHTPHLQNSAATYRWTSESIRVTRALLNRKNCARVQVPVLLFQAEYDDLVLPKAQEAFLARIPNGRLVRVRGAKHEIYRSPEPILTPYVRQVLRFFLEE